MSFDPQCDQCVAAKYACDRHITTFEENEMLDSHTTLEAQIEAQIAKAICENVGGAIMLLPEQSKKAAKVITALPAIVTALRQAGGRIDEWTVEELRQSVRTTVDAPNCGHNTYARTIGISSAKLSEFLSGKRGAEPSIIEPMGFRWALVNSDLYPRLEERPDADGFTPVEKDDALRQAEAAPAITVTVGPCTHVHLAAMPTVGQMSCLGCRWQRPMTPEEFAHWNPPFEEPSK